MHERRGSSGVHSRHILLLLGTRELFPLVEILWGMRTSLGGEDMQDRSHRNAGPLQTGSSIRAELKEVIG